MAAGFPTASNPGDPGRSCNAFHDLVAEVTYHDFHCICHQVIPDSLWKETTEGFPYLLTGGKKHSDLPRLGL